jgi:hypothetical protein
MRCGMAWQLLTRHHTATGILHLLAPIVRRNYPLLPRRQRELFGILFRHARLLPASFRCSQEYLLSCFLAARLLCVTTTRIPRFFSLFYAGFAGTIASEMCHNNPKAWPHFHMRSIRVGQEPLGGASGVRSHKTSSLSPVRARYTCD